MLTFKQKENPTWQLRKQSIRRKRQFGPIEDRNGNILTEKQNVPSRWEGYCDKLNDYQLKDQKLLDILRSVTVTEQEENQPILQYEV